MRKGKIKVLIAGVGGGCHGMEIMKALRLSNIPYYICGVDMSKRSLGLFKADKGYVVPPAFNDEYIPTILDICKKEGIQVIFHGSEPDIEVLSENRDIFEEMGIFLPFNSREVINTCLDKKQTFIFLKQKGITIPKTVAVDSEKDIDAIDFLPAVIKPYIGGGGSNNAFIAQDREELALFCRYILKQGRTPVVQPYIGSSKNEYTVGVLSDREGNIISTIAIKRYILSGLSNRLKVPSISNRDEVLAISSGVSQGEVVNEPELLDQCRQIAFTLRSTGPVNIQCRFVNKKVYPFEINPRFSGTTHMRALAGVNEPDLLIRKYVLKETIPENIVAKEGLVLRELKETFIPMRLNDYVRRIEVER
jgi:carbamoyl-phosphate synthase large subunit